MIFNLGAFFFFLGLVVVAWTRPRPVIQGMGVVMTWAGMLMASGSIMYAGLQWAWIHLP
jgi:hypothetical protein